MTDPTATPALTPAAQNPWYLLATLYGEPGWGDEIQAKNRVAWNRYYASQWTDKQRAALKGRVDPAELVPFDEAELAHLRRQFQDRAKDVQAEMPDASETANLRDSRFQRAVYFFGYVFANASFGNATFSGFADFSSANFCGHPDFSGATFSGVVDFRRSTFSKDADFSRATFSGTAHFGGTSFSGAADFSSVTFSGPAYFSSATFHHAAIFTNSELKAPTDFEKSRFLGEPPRFHAQSCMRIRSGAG